MTIYRVGSPIVHIGAEVGDCIVDDQGAPITLSLYRPLVGRLTRADLAGPRGDRGDRGARPAPAAG